MLAAGVAVEIVDSHAGVFEDGAELADGEKLPFGTGGGKAVAFC